MIICLDLIVIACLCVMVSCDDGCVNISIQRSDACRQLSQDGGHKRGSGEEREHVLRPPGQDRSLHPWGDPGHRDIREGQGGLPPADRAQGGCQDPQQVLCVM